MKTKLLAVSLITASGLFADSAICEPCCIPQPKKCIDCECYTPAYYDLQCAWGTFISIDYLFWYARETNLNYATKLKRIEASSESLDSILVPTSYKNIDTSWDPGFRIGLGWNSSCDGWDTSLNWTYMRNKSYDDSSVHFGNDTIGEPLIGESVLTNPWITTTQTIYPAFLDTILAKWKLTYNVIDLELGRNYWLSRCFTLRPFAGLRGAWTKTHFSTRSWQTLFNVDSDTLQIPIVSLQSKFNDRYTNRTWGIGLLTGLQPNWYFSPSFAFFANLDMSLIWGKFKNTEKHRNENHFNAADTTFFLDSSFRAKNDFYQMTAIIDAAIGLHWETTWCCDRYRTVAELGWEHHIWFDQNHRNQTEERTLSIATNIEKTAEVTGNLGLGGLVLRFRWDF